MKTFGPKTKQPPIIFFGNEQIAHGINTYITPTLESLIDAGYNIVAVFTSPDFVAKRGKKLESVRTKQIALMHDISVYQPTNKKELEDAVITVVNNTTLKPVGVLESYGHIIPNKVLELFEPHGIINIHPSLLPKYRGATPIETAMLNDDRATGVSIIKLTSEMDAGPIYAQQTITLTGHETKDELYNQLSNLGAKLLIGSLPAITSGKLRIAEQDDAKATYCSKLTTSMSPLNAAQKTARQLVCQVRAFAGFPKSKLVIAGLNCTITQASESVVKITTIDQQCLDGKYLVIEKLIPPSGKEMTALDFINGYLR